MAEQQADSGRKGQRDRRPERSPARAVRSKRRRIPPERQVGEASERKGRPRNEREAATPAAEGRLTDQERRRQADAKRGGAAGRPKQQPEIGCDDEPVAGPGDEARNPRRHANRRRGAEQEGGQDTDPDACEPPERERPVMTCCRSKDEAVDAGIEVTQRTKLATQI